MIVAATFLGGCSALRIGYGTAPDIVYWWLDRYIDFDDGQTPRVREAIAQWFDWHRRTQLPDYADQLARARRDVMADTTPARICAWQAEAVKRARLAWEQIAPDAAAVAMTVTPRQLAYLERRYDKYNVEYRDDFLQADPERRAEAALKRVVDRAESLYGGLDDAQRTRIADGLARSPFDPEVWFAERRLRQQDALRILRTAGRGGQTRDQTLMALNGYAERLERSPRVAYQRYASHLNEFNCAFAAEVHNVTTPAQRRRAADRLAGWEGDLRAVAAAKPRARSEP